MSIISVIVGICIVGLGIWNAQNHKVSVTTTGDVQGETAPTLSPTPTLMPSESPTSAIDPSTTPTRIPTKAPTIQITISQNNTTTSSLSISKFQYPGASVSSSSNNRLELTTNDSSKTVTDWYKNQINSLGMNTKSFVTTSANDNIVNKLVAADGKDEIRVDITKAPSDASVRIVIELK